MEVAARFIWPQIMSGLRSLYLNDSTRTFLEFAFFFDVLFFDVKNDTDGFLRNARAAKTNLPTFSVDIAAPRFLFGSIGSIITILESKSLLGNLCSIDVICFQKCLE